MKRTNVYLTDRQIEALKALAATTGLTASELLRRALDEYLRHCYEQGAVTRDATTT